MTETEEDADVSSLCIFQFRHWHWEGETGELNLTGLWLVALGMENLRGEVTDGLSKKRGWTSSFEKFII